MSKRKNRSEREIETTSDACDIAGPGTLIGAEEIARRFRDTRCKVGGRREAIVALIGTARTAFSLLSEQALMLRESARRIEEIDADRCEQRDRIRELESLVALRSVRFASLAAETGRARSKDDPAPLVEEAGIWLAGHAQTWIDPGETRVFPFCPMIPFLATHLAVPPLAPGVVEHMRFTSIKCALIEHVLSTGGAIPASLYAVRFPEDAAEPIERGAALPEHIRLWPQIHLVAAVRNDGPARALFECAVFGRRLSEAEIRQGMYPSESHGPSRRGDPDRAC